MSRKRKSSATKQAQEPVKPSKVKRILNIDLPVILIAVLGLVAYVVFFADNKPTATTNTFNTTPKVARKAKSLGELLEMSPEQLGQVDIAEMNLLCATGLPGAERLDEAEIARCLARLDQWAARVKFETERHLYRLTDPRYKDHAEHYKHSEARFRAEWLVGILQQDIGLHYHAGFVTADKAVVPPKTSKEHFLHGLMDNEDAHKAFGGNCVSLPVAYVAVARRLGYPVKLVSSKEHAFCRWEGQNHPNPAWRDRFNFDGAGKGFSIDPDEFYLSWPRKSTPDQVELCDWLKSLTPQQELATFVAHRGHILAKVEKDLPDALIAFSHAARLWPSSRSPLQNVQFTLDELWTREIASHPQTYRRVYGVQVANGRVVPVKIVQVANDKPKLPWWKTEAGRAANLAEVRRINEINRRNIERLMQPPQPYGPANPHRPYRPPTSGQHLPHHPGYQPHRPHVPGQPRR